MSIRSLAGFNVEPVLAFIRWLLAWFGLIQKPDFVVSRLTEHPAPESLAEGRLYIVGDGAHAKWAYFRCPADTNEIVQLSLMPTRRPRWEVQVDGLGRPTVRPSVRQTDGSFAHFWITKGKIDWCADSGRLLH